MPHTFLFMSLVSVLAWGCADKKAPTSTPPAAAATSGETAPPTAKAPATKTPSAAPSTATPSTATAGKISFSTLAPSTLPTTIKTKGTVDHAIEWTDQNGRNIVTFTSTEKKTDGHLTDRWLFINHDVVGAAGPRRLRKVQDGIKACEFDVHAKMVNEALGVTDLDGDGLGEVSFAYVTTCTSDISPFALKLLLLENGEKYIIRGTTRMNLGAGLDNAVEGGEKKVDPSVAKAPAAFGTHLDGLWEKVVGPWSPGGNLQKK